MRLLPRKKRTCRFYNLAEQLACQNAIVGRTMDSLVEHVSQLDEVTQRSDWEEIRETARHMTGTVPAATHCIPGPKLAQRQSTDSVPQL